jgi:hypothetical protein
VAGFYVAVVVTMGGGLMAGRSLVVLAGLCAVCGLSFFAYGHLRRLVTGRECFVLLEHVWFAEGCVAATLWALDLPILAYLDPVAVGLCFFLAAGRIGCLLVGCCHGRPSSVGIRYGEEAARDGFPQALVGVRLFPVPAIEAGALVAIGLSGLVALPFAPAGAVFTWFLVAYSVVRFGLEGLRGDLRPHLLGLSVNRWMCIVEFSVALEISAHQHGGIGARELGLFGALAALLVAALSLRAVVDQRPRVLSAEHVAEVEELARRAIADPFESPGAETTSRGVVVAATAAPDGVPLSHVSLSWADGHADLWLLCELAARAFPGTVTDTAVHSDRNVLHVLVADVAGPPPDAHRLALALHGRLALGRPEQPAGEEVAEARVPGPTRAAYFGG